MESAQLRGAGLAPGRPEGEPLAGADAADARTRSLSRAVIHGKRVHHPDRRGAHPAGRRPGGGESREIPLRRSHVQRRTALRKSVQDVLSNSTAPAAPRPAPRLGGPAMAQGRFGTRTSPPSPAPHPVAPSPGPGSHPGGVWPPARRSCAPCHLRTCTARGFGYRGWLWDPWWPEPVPVGPPTVVAPTAPTSHPDSPGRLPSPPRARRSTRTACRSSPSARSGAPSSASPATASTWNRRAARSG